MIRKLLIAFGLGLAVVLPNIGVADATNAATTTQSPLLRFEPTSWVSGAPTYDFGVNNGPEWTEPAMSELPSVQTDLKDARVTLDRVWAYDSDSDATVQRKVAAAEAAGMQCMFVLGSTNDLSWMEHVVSMIGPKCIMYEFGNEPDNYGSVAGNIQGDTSEWIADVPKLRALDPSALFGGPALTWSMSDNGGTSYGSDMAYFLAETAAAGVRANFISYHDYPCQKATSEADCISMTPGDFQWNYDQVVALEQQYYGGIVPTGVTEYNFDAGSNNLYSWGGDSAFMGQWTETALDEIVALHMAFANLYTALDYAGYGDLDMFSDSAPYAPKAQFFGLAAEVDKYDPLATKVYDPTCGGTVKGASVFDAFTNGLTSVTGTTVTVVATGGSLSDKVMATTTPTIFGWLAKWTTTGVPDGTYTLQSVVTVGGTKIMSAGCTIKVSN